MDERAVSVGLAYCMRQAVAEEFNGHPCRVLCPCKLYSEKVKSVDIVIVINRNGLDRGLVWNMR
jgi:hypothetical protein